MAYYSLEPDRPGEALARQLERLPGCRVLRQLPQSCNVWCHTMPAPANTLRLGVVDCETTGLDALRHKLIELAVAKLTIDLDAGAVAGVDDPVTWLEDPGEPISARIEALTGLGDRDVRGMAFDERAIAVTLADVDLLVSHNAAFDAGFCRARFPWLALPWACSALEVDWASHGLAGGRGIGALMTAAGHFLPDAHRAGPDAWALTCLLARPSGDGRAIAAHLIDTARRPTLRSMRAVRRSRSRTSSRRPAIDGRPRAAPGGSKASPSGSPTRARGSTRSIR